MENRVDQDRRRWTRYRPELDTTHIRFPGGVAKGEVADHSFGGASFRTGTVGIEQGMQIEVLWKPASETVAVG